MSQNGHVRDRSRDCGSLSLLLMRRHVLSNLLGLLHLSGNVLCLLHLRGHLRLLYLSHGVRSHLLGLLNSYLLGLLNGYLLSLRRHLLGLLYSYLLRLLYLSRNMMGLYVLRRHRRRDILSGDQSVHALRSRDRSRIRGYGLRGWWRKEVLLNIR